MQKRIVDQSELENDLEPCNGVNGEDGEEHMIAQQALDEEEDLGAALEEVSDQTDLASE